MVLYYTCLDQGSLVDTAGPAQNSTLDRQRTAHRLYSITSINAQPFRAKMHEANKRYNQNSTPIVAGVKDNLGPIWILATNSQLLKLTADLFGSSANKPTNVLPTIQLTIAISVLVYPS